MLIVGELINSSRKEIAAAIEAKNEQLIKDLALNQAAAGADYIDVNCGTLIYNEVETMNWLVANILAVAQAPLCIDSPSEKALAAGLAAAKANGAQPMVNSITAESERYAKVLPLIKEYGARVVGLCMDDTGMPETAADRLRIVDKLVGDLARDGVPLGDIYLDPLVKPISVGDRFGVELLQAIRGIRQNYPEVHIICGLSNVSFGLPRRPLINRAFMILCLEAGIDGFILNPCDKEMMGLLHATRALLGQDEYCRRYLTAFKKGLI